MASRLDVIFITRKWAPAVGGMETWSMQISEALGEFADLAIVALPGRTDGRPPSTSSLLGFPFTVLKHRIKRRASADIVHIGDLALWPMALLSTRSKGTVINAHGTDASFQRRKGLMGSLYKAYLKLGARMLKRAVVIANSDATAEAVRETGWSNVEVIPLATNMVAESTTETSSKHLLFAGRLIPLKGLSWFVESVLPHLPSEITLHVAGPKTDPGEAEALKHPRVTYLGTLGEKELAQAYREALCVVVPNIVPEDGTFEGFGLVATEASAAGGVVLASRTGGLSAAILDEKTGFLVPAGDADAWISAISGIADWTASERSDFISEAQAHIDTHFRWNVAAMRTLGVYRAAQSLPEI